MKLKESRNLTCTCYKLRLFFFSSIYPTAYIKRDNDDEASIKLYIYTSIIKFLSRRNTRQNGGI